MLRGLPLYLKYMLFLSKFVIKTCSSASARNSTFHSTLLITFVSLFHLPENPSSDIWVYKYHPSLSTVQILFRTEVRQQVLFFLSVTASIRTAKSSRHWILSEKYNLKRTASVWVVLRNNEFEWEKGRILTKDTANGFPGFLNLLLLPLQTR